MRRHEVALVAATCALAVSAWGATARAADQEAIFSLVVNRVESGEVLAVLRDGDVLVARSDLIAAGLQRFACTEVKVGERTLVSLASIRPAVRFRVDEEEVALRIDAPVAILPATHVDLAAAPPDISYARRTSAFLNYAPRLTFPSPGAANGGAFVEAGVSESNRLYYSGASATTEYGAVRGLTNVTFDDRPKMRKLIVGDANVSAGAIGGAAVIGGVTFARDFDLNPYFIRFPSMRFASATEVPARVDVYVNGVRVRSEELQPGTFTLDNVRGLVGAGTVRYVVRDVLGRQQLYSLPYYVGPSVLAKGLDDYAVSVGFPRDQVGFSSFTYEGPSLIGYYARGISDHVTVGARAEARWERASAGPSIAATTPFGLFSLEAGASVATDARAGAAAIASYQYLSRALNAGGSLRVLTDDYTTTTLRPEMDRSLYQATAFVSVPIAHRASFAGNLAVDVHRDVPAFARLGVFGQYQIGRDVTVLGETALVNQGTGTSDVEGFLSLSWTPAFGIYTNAGVQRSGGVNGANLQVMKSAGFGEDWALAGAVDLSSTPRASVNHRLQTGAADFTTFLDWRPDAASLSFEPAGALVWVDGSRVFFTRPVFDSFALVRVPNVKGVRVYENSQEVGRTDARGDLLVPSLISYYGTQIKIASEDVPLDYALERDTVTAAPPRRGAGYVEFRAARVHYYRGRLRIAKHGALEVPVYGDLVVKNRGEEMTSPIGADGSFELEGLTTGPHDAEVQYKAERCRFTFEATEADAPLIDLGVLRCTLE